MSRKKKGNKPTSARGHVEGNVIRLREEKRLIRVDRKGRPINKPIPINTFDRNWLAQNLIDSNGYVLSSPPKPPNNVSKMSDHRPKPNPAPVSGNEAESIPTPSKGKVDFSFLHDKNIAADEFRNWSRISKEIGRGVAIEHWTKEGSKLHSATLDDQRRRSIEGHTKPKLKFKSPPSIVRNPMLSAKPIAVHNQRLREQSGKGLAHSGIPIAEFVTGKYKPIENPVVYTTLQNNPATRHLTKNKVYTDKWPFVRQATPLPPPTASKHWHGKAANDGNVHHLRRTPTEQSIEHKLNSEVQWFINHVEPQNWPTHVHNFAHWKGGGPTPNTGAINKAAAEWGTRYNLMKSMYHGLQEDWKMLDSALSMSHQEINLLNQELQAEKRERMSLEWQLAASVGDHVSADEIAAEMQNNIIKSKTPDVPDDADVMLAQFKVYQSFVKCDGPEHAFARYVYGDPRLGEVIRNHADMRCKERQDAVVGRTYARNLSKFLLALGKYKEEQHVKFWRDATLINAKRKNRAKFTAVRPVHAEATAYAAMSRKAKPALHKQSSIYYSALERTTVVNNAVAKGLLSKVRPVRYHDCTAKRASYEKWWSQWLDYCELKYHESTPTGRVKIGIVKTYNKIVDTLNTPVDPPTRKRQRDKMTQMLKQQSILDEQREQRKERNKKRKHDREIKRKLRQAYGVAH